MNICKLQSKILFYLFNKKFNLIIEFENQKFLKIRRQMQKFINLPLIFFSTHKNIFFFSLKGKKVKKKCPSIKNKRKLVEKNGKIQIVSAAFGFQ